MQRMAASKIGVDIAAGENACTAFEFAKMLEVLFTTLIQVACRLPALPYRVTTVNVWGRLGPYVLLSRQ